jgi:predicted nuclease of predicted toxin-antitoxin system
LFIDQDVPGRTASLLRAVGHDAVSAFELGMSRATDETNIGFAAANGRVIATLDSDYHRILATEGRTQPSVIQLHGKEQSSRISSNLIDLASRRYETELLAGCLLSCSLGSMRLRMLPISRR